MNGLLETTADQAAETFFDNELDSRRRILVVDDDAALRHLMMEVLAASGYEVDDADNGARAWKALHLKPYDLMVTDHEMPELTGLQLVDKLRAARFELPIIVATGSLIPELMAKCARIRSVSMLSKPFTLDELIQTVERHLPCPRPKAFNLVSAPSHGRENHCRY